MHAARLPSSPPLAAALAALLLAGCAGPRAGGSPTWRPGERRTFPVPDQGALSIEVPRGWTVRVGELEPGAPVSIRLDAPGGGALFLAPLHDPETAQGAAGLDTARLFTELARRSALPMATDPELPIAALRGADGAEVGYWFVATDREYVAPGPGQERWRNLLRGAATVGRLLVSFTWFDDTPGPAREQVLALVRGAQHEGAAGGAGQEGAGAFELTPDPDALTVPLAVQAPGVDFTVLVDLPGFEVYEPRPAPDGEGYLVLGQDPGSGLVASVTVRPADGSPDARACRDAVLARLRRSAPDLSEVRTAEDQRAARLRYRLDELNGEKVRQEHAHAFLARGGRCVDVHASKASPGPDDAARLDALLATVRFAEML